MILQIFCNKTNFQDHTDYGTLVPKLVDASTKTLFDVVNVYKIRAKMNTRIVVLGITQCPFPTYK